MKGAVVSDEQESKQESDKGSDTEPFNPHRQAKKHAEGDRKQFAKPGQEKRG